MIRIKDLVLVYIFCTTTRHSFRVSDLKFIINIFKFKCDIGWKDSKQGSGGLNELNFKLFWSFIDKIKFLNWFYFVLILFSIGWKFWACSIITVCSLCRKHIHNLHLTWATYIVCRTKKCITCQKHHSVMGPLDLQPLHKNKQKITALI